jgi:hypothetical protein
MKIETMTNIKIFLKKRKYWLKTKKKIYMIIKNFKLLLSYMNK